MLNKIDQKIAFPEQLMEFVDLKTVRKCYTKDNVNVVIDSTDWGYRVGEIEIVVPDQDQVIQATKKIEDLGKELGKSSLANQKRHRLQLLPKLLKILFYNFRGSKYR